MSIVEDRIRQGVRQTGRIVLLGLRFCRRGIRQLAAFGGVLVWALSRGLYLPVRAMGMAVTVMAGVLWGGMMWGGILARALIREVRGGTRKAVLDAGFGFLQWSTARDGAAFFCMLGATLIIGGLWVIQPPAKPSSPEGFLQGETDDPAMARVNQTVIRLSDVTAYAVQAGKLDRMHALTAATAWRRGLVEETIEHFLIAGAAHETGILDGPGIKARLKAARNRIAVATFLDGQIDEIVTPRAIWDVYEAQLTVLAKNDEYRLSVIEMTSPETARAVKKALDLGVPFEEMARKYSVDSASSSFGGDLGYVRLYAFPGTVTETVLALSEGEVSRLLKDGRKWYLYRLTGRKATAPPSYAQVKDNIRSYLAEEVIVRTMEELTDTADITLYKDGYSTRPARVSAD